MGFTSDCICIKNDYSFERIENLKIGDILYNPYDKNGSKIINIIEEYEEEGFLLTTNNFFDIKMNTSTLIQNSSLELINNKYYLKNPTYLTPDKLKKISFLLTPKLAIKDEKEIEDLFLYARTILRGEIRTKTIILKNYKDKIKNYEKNIKNSEIETGKNNEVHNLYIKIKEIPKWKRVLELKTSQRYLYKDIYSLNDEKLNYFLTNLLKENTDQFLNLKEFRLYTKSKIIVTQLYYLILSRLGFMPKVEQIKKDIWDVKRIKESNKRNTFAISHNKESKDPICKNDMYYHQIKGLEKNNKRIKYYKIITENNKEFVVYNIIVKEKV